MKSKKVAIVVPPPIIRLDQSCQNESVPIRIFLEYKNQAGQVSSKRSRTEWRKPFPVAAVGVTRNSRHPVTFTYFRAPEADISHFRRPYRNSDHQHPYASVMPGWKAYLGSDTAYKVPIPTLLKSNPDANGWNEMIPTPQSNRRMRRLTTYPNRYRR